MENSPVPSSLWGCSNRSRRGLGFVRGTSKAWRDRVPGRRREGSGREGAAGTGRRLRKPGLKVPIVPCQPSKAAKPATPTGVSGGPCGRFLSNVFLCTGLWAGSVGKARGVGRAQVALRILGTNIYTSRAQRRLRVEGHCRLPLKIWAPTLLFVVTPLDWHRGGGRPPATPSYIRVLHGGFEKVTLAVFE